MDPVSLRKLKVQLCTVLSASSSKKWDTESLIAHSWQVAKLARTDDHSATGNFGAAVAKVLCSLVVSVCCTNPSGLQRAIGFIQQLDRLFNRAGIADKGVQDPTAGPRTAFAYELCVLAHGGTGSYSARNAVQVSAKDSRAANQLLAQVRPLLSSTLVNSCRDTARQAASLDLQGAGDRPNTALLELIGHMCSMQGDYSLSTVLYELCGPLSSSSLVSAYFASGHIQEALALTVRCAKALDHSTADSFGLNAPTDPVHMLQFSAAQPGQSQDEDERQASWEASLPYRLTCFTTGAIMAQYFSSGTLEQVLGSRYASRNQTVHVLQPHNACFSVLTGGSGIGLGSMEDAASLQGKDILPMLQDSTSCTVVQMDLIESTVSKLPLWTPMLGIHLLLRASGVCDTGTPVTYQQRGQGMTPFQRRCVDMAVSLACSAQATVIPLRHEYTGHRMDVPVSLLTSGARSAAEAMGVSYQSTLDSLPADLLLADPEGLSTAYSVGTHPGAYMCPPVLSHCLSFLSTVLSVLHARSHASATGMLDALRAAGTAAAVAAAERGDRESLQALLRGIMSCESACKATVSPVAASDGGTGGHEFHWRALDVATAACKAAAERVVQAMQAVLAEGVRLAVDGADSCAVSSSSSTQDDNTGGTGGASGQYTRQTPNPWIPARYKAAAALMNARAAQQAYNSGQPSESSTTPFPLPELVVQSVQSLPASSLSAWPTHASASKPEQLQAAVHAAIADTPLLADLCLSGACSDPSIRAYVRQCIHEVDCLTEGSVRAILRHAAHTADMSGNKQAKEKTVLQVATHAGKDDGDMSTASLFEPVLVLLDSCALVRTVRGDKDQQGEDATAFWGTIAEVMLGRPPAAVSEYPVPVQSALCTVSSALTLAVIATWTVHVKDTVAAVFSGRLLASKLGHVVEPGSSSGAIDHSAALQYAVGSLSSSSGARLLTLLAIMQPYAPDEGRGEDSVAQQLMVAAAEVLCRESVYVSAVAARPLLLSFPSALDARLPPAAKQAISKARTIVAGAKGLRVVDPAGLLPHILPSSDAAHVQDEMASAALRAHTQPYPFTPDRDILQEPLASALPLLMRDSGFRDFSRSFLFLLCCGILYTPPVAAVSGGSSSASVREALQQVHVEGIPSGLEEVLTREIDLAAHEQRQLAKGSSAEGHESHGHAVQASRMALPLFASPIVKTRTLARMMKPAQQRPRMGVVSASGLFSPVPAAAPPGPAPTTTAMMMPTDPLLDLNASHESTGSADAKTVIRSLFSIRHVGQQSGQQPKVSDGAEASEWQDGSSSSAPAPSVSLPPLRSSIALSQLIQNAKGGRGAGEENGQTSGTSSSASVLNGPAMFLSPVGPSRAAAPFLAPFPATEGRAAQGQEELQQGDSSDIQQPLKSRLDLTALTRAASTSSKGMEASSTPATSAAAPPVSSSTVSTAGAAQDATDALQQQLHSPGSSTSTFDPRRIPADVALAAAAQLLSAHGLRLLVATPPKDHGEDGRDGGEDDAASRPFSPMRTTLKVVPLIVPSPQSSQAPAPTHVSDSSSVLLHSSLRTAKVHLDADRPADSIPLVVSAPEPTQPAHADVSTNTQDLPAESGEHIGGKATHALSPLHSQGGIAASGSRRGSHQQSSQPSAGPSTPPRGAPSLASPAPVSMQASPLRSSSAVTGNPSIAPPALQQQPTGMGTPQRPVPSVDYLVQSMTKSTRASAQHTLGMREGTSSQAHTNDAALHAVVQPSSISLPNPPPAQRRNGAAAVILADISPEHAVELLQEAKRRGIARTVSGPAFVPAPPMPGQGQGSTARAMRDFMGDSQTSEQEEVFPDEDAFRPGSHAGSVAWQGQGSGGGMETISARRSTAAGNAAVNARSRDEEAAVAVAYASVGSELDRVKAQMAILNAQTESLSDIAQRVADDWAERDVEEAQAVLQAALQRRAINLRSMRDRVDMLLTQTTLQVAGAGGSYGAEGTSGLLSHGGPITHAEVEQLHYALPPTRYGGSSQRSGLQGQRSPARGALSTSNNVSRSPARPVTASAAVGAHHSLTPMSTPTGGRAYTGRGPIMPTLASPGSLRGRENSGHSFHSITPSVHSTPLAGRQAGAGGATIPVGSLARPGPSLLTTPPTVWAPRTARGKTKSPAR